MKNRMNSFIATLIGLLAVPSALSVLPQTEQQTFQPATGVNLLSNPGFENGKTGWNYSVNSPTIFAPIIGASDSIEGNGSLVFTPTGSGQYFESPLMDFPSGREGAACLAAIRSQSVETTDLYVLRVLKSDNTDVVTDPNSTNPSKYPQIPTSLGLTEKSAIKYVSFACPPAGTKYKMRVQSTASSPAPAKYDSAWFGTDYRVRAAPAGAQWYGSAVWPVTANCSWVASQTSYADYAADPDCVNPTVSGMVQAPATKIPGVVLPSGGSGRYLFIVNGQFEKNNATVGVANWRLYDGTNGTPDINILYTNTVNPSSGSGQGAFSYAAFNSAKTVRIQSKQNADATQTIIGNVQSTLSIDVYYFPNATEVQGVAVDSFNWRVSANISGANPSLGTSAVSSYAGIEDSSLTLTNDPTNSLSALIPCSGTNAPSGTTCSAGNESVGVSFNAPRAGRVRACFQFTWEGHSSSSIGAAFQLVRTPNDAQTILEEGGARIQASHATTTAMGHPFNVCGNFNVSAGMNTIRLMYEQVFAGSITSSLVLADGSSSNGQRDIKIDVWPLDYVESAFARYAGMVTSNSESSERVERVLIAGGSASTACSSSPCTTYNESGDWVSSVTRSNTGDYTVNFNSGVFSAAPVCVCSGSGNRSCATESTTTTTARLLTYGTSGGGASDASPSVICMGPK